MNPYLVEDTEVRKKSVEWQMNNKDKNPIMDPYLSEKLRLGMLKREWDMDINSRKQQIKHPNNPWIQEFQVQVRDDLSFILCPRIKLEYDYILLHYIRTAPMNARKFAESIRLSFMENTPSIYFDLHEVVTHRLYHNRIHNYDIDGSREGTLVSKVNIFIRDLSFIGDCDININSDLYSKINLAYESLAQKFGIFSFTSCGHQIYMKAKHISSQDPCFLLSQFHTANPEYMGSAIPVIILNNLVSKWFVQPNSSEPSKELLIGFLCAFGEIRYLSVSKNKLEGELFSVSVQYQDNDDFLKALRTLCCCSLRQGDSGELVDYEVTLGRDDVFPSQG
ncbi:uncharacterized protein LOC141591671 isoform X2 [Silene latifolia]|uniref:uncharacterized protein LOC141591671 isoform X2 n=1 Tax=Silene latifolia TaxID=37657 RepID=UPI003D785466